MNICAWCVENSSFLMKVPSKLVKCADGLMT